MQGPCVSVCIVTYNHERYIRQCIMSVMAQTQDVPLEILVGDDLSSDGTESIVRELADRFPESIRYFRHTTRKGPAGNYQLLIKEARGQYIAHLDGDDFWLPGKLAAQVEFLKTYADCPSVYTNAFCIHDNGTPDGIFNNTQPMRFNINALLHRGNFLNHSSMLYRATLKHELSEMQAPFLDYRIHLRLARHGDIGYLNQALTVYRVSSSSSIILNANDNVRILYWEALCDVPVGLVNPRDLSQGMAEFMRTIFFRSIRTHSWSLITTWWPRILERTPAGKVGMLAWAAWAIWRTGMSEISALLCRRLTGNPMKIHYRR